MKPGEGGQVAPSLPGSGQTCLESQGRTRSSNPPTRSLLTQPAASPLLLGLCPHPPHSALTAPPHPLPPASPPAPLLIHLARTAQTAQGAHTASLCAELEPEAAGTPGHARPQLKLHLKAEDSSSPGDFKELRLRGTSAERPPKPAPGQSSSRRSARADRRAQWPRLAAPWSGSPARNHPPPACPKHRDWSTETYQGWILPTCTKCTSQDGE